jgi:hypothetical protein
MAFSIKAVVADIEKDEKTVVSWLVAEYAKFYKDEPAIATVVDDTINYVELGLPIVLGATGGAALAAPIDNALNEIVSDLKVVSATIYDFGPAPNVASVIAGVQTELSSLETVAHITDPAKLAKLQLIVNAVATLYQLVLKAITPAATPAPAAA